MTLSALSIRQPWAWLIIHGGKDIENRTWADRRHETIAIHASKTCPDEDYDQARYSVSKFNLELAKQIPPREELQFGGIIGTAFMNGCVRISISPWFTGPIGFRLSNPKPVPFIPIVGRMGFFKVDWPL